MLDKTVRHLCTVLTNTQKTLPAFLTWVETDITSEPFSKEFSSLIIN